MQLRFEGMLDPDRFLDRVLDLHAGLAQIGQALRQDRDTDRFTVDDRVEGAAERHVGVNLAIADHHRHRRVEDE